MSLPDTLAGVLVLILAVLPGVPGDYVFRGVVGVSWREKDFTRLVRLVSLSVAGLMLYAICAGILGLPAPDHVVPATFAADSFFSSSLPSLGLAYLGHVAGATVAGAISAGGMWLLAKVTPASTERDTWDEFVHKTVEGRWVLVSLTGGETYLGIIHHADVATPPEFRDVILAEPYRYDPRLQRYAPTRHQHLFLRGTDLASIATIYDASMDAAGRVIPVDDAPFSEQADV